MTRLVQHRRGRLGQQDLGDAVDETRAASRSPSPAARAGILTAVVLAILLAMDLAYGTGPVLAAVAPAAGVAAQSAVLSLALGIIGIQARSGGRYGLLRLESVLIVATYAAAVAVLVRAA